MTFAEVPKTSTQGMTVIHGVNREETLLPQGGLADRCAPQRSDESATIKASS
jgi:hypothetical protein